MAKAAARIGDTHSCQGKEPLPGSPPPPPAPHVPSPLSGPGCVTVFIGGQVAAVAGDPLICLAPPAPPPPPNKILSGSTSVFFGGKAAARQDDPTAHGGKITSGFATVLIGG